MFYLNFWVIGAAQLYILFLSLITIGNNWIIWLRLFQHLPVIWLSINLTNIYPQTPNNRHCFSFNMLTCNVSYFTPKYQNIMYFFKFLQLIFGIYEWNKVKDFHFNTKMQFLKKFQASYLFLYTQYSVACNTSNITVLVYKNPYYTPQFSSVQSLSHVRLFATPWIAARQASLSITNSRSSSNSRP